MSSLCDILFQYCWAVLSIRNGMDSLYHFLFAAVGCQSCGQQQNKGMAYWVCGCISGLIGLSFCCCLKTQVLPFPLHPCWVLHFDCFPGVLQSTAPGSWSLILKQARKWEGEQTHLLWKGHLGWTVKKCPITSSTDLQFSKMEVSKHFHYGCLLGTLGKGLIKVFISI